MERYNKSTMPENAEKYCMTYRENRTHDLDNTTALSRQPQKRLFE